jgi:hypothetical protein
MANGKEYNSREFCDFGVLVLQNDLLFASMTVKGLIDSEFINNIECI